MNKEQINDLMSILDDIVSIYKQIIADGEYFIFDKVNQLEYSVDELRKSLSMEDDIE